MLKAMSLPVLIGMVCVTVAPLVAEMSWAERRSVWSWELSITGLLLICFGPLLMGWLEETK